MKCVFLRRDEIESFVEAAYIVVLRVSKNCSCSNDLGSAERAPKCVFEHGTTEPSPYLSVVDGETREQDDGNRIASEALGYGFRRVFRHHGACGKSVVRDDMPIAQRDIGSAPASALIGERVPLQVLVKLRFPAREATRLVSALEQHGSGEWSTLLTAQGCSAPSSIS